MTNFKGTQGKWLVAKDFYSQGIDQYLPIKSNIKNRPWIAESKGSHVNKGMKTLEMEANALLISKAPEMLKMLEGISNLNEGSDDFLNSVRKLIKEATEL